MDKNNKKSQKKNKEKKGKKKSRKKSRYQKKPEEFKKTARERIKTLFSLAETEFDDNPELSHRYVSLARKIAMKYKVKIPKELKRRICKHCHRFLVPGKNCRVRTKDGKVVYFCENCRHYMRFPYTKEKTKEKQKRKKEK